jgi:hypothetical protein
MNAAPDAVVLYIVPPLRGSEDLLARLLDELEEKLSDLESKQGELS